MDSDVKLVLKNIENEKIKVEIGETFDGDIAKEIENKLSFPKYAVTGNSPEATTPKEICDNNHQ